MTTIDFCVWLDGYLTDREELDVDEVNKIKERLAKTLAPKDAPKDVPKPTVTYTVPKINIKVPNSFWAPWVPFTVPTVTFPTVTFPSSTFEYVVTTTTTTFETPKSKK